jgi:SAM-dependent methyltransferase
MARVSGSTKPARPEPAGTARSRLEDALAGDVLLRHVAGCRVLDLGHASPELATWVQRHTTEPLTIVERGALDPPEGPVFLPELADRSFDVIYCLGALAHLGDDAPSSERRARELLAEAARLAAPGGTILVDIANPRSLRGLLAGIRHPRTVVAARTMVVADEQRLTRWDTVGRLKRLLPESLSLVEVHGLAVLVPHGGVLEVPLLGRLLARLEWAARDNAVLRHFGSRVLVVLHKAVRVDRAPEVSTASLVALQS